MKTAILYVRLRLREECAVAPWTDDLAQGAPFLLTSSITCEHFDTMCSECRASWLMDWETHLGHCVFAIPDPFDAL